MSEGAAYDRLNNLAPGGGMDYVIFADDPGETIVASGCPTGLWEHLGRPAAF